MKIAICDTEAFYPLRALVNGPFSNMNDLVAVERFIRTVLLHDEMVMELTPWSYDPETDFELTEDEKKAGGRLVITALGPTRTGFDFFAEQTQPQFYSEIQLAPDLVKVASRFANADADNVFFETHVSFIKKVLGIVEQGGSSLLCSDFGKEIITTAEKYPELLFHQLDEDWQRYAQTAQRNGLGLLIPPVLGIVLRRCARRDDIPKVIQDLRDEWAVARQKVWERLDALRACRTLREAIKIERELTEASRLFSPNRNEVDSRPVRIFWEITTAAAAGAGIAQLSGGKPVIGAATGAISQLARLTPAAIHEFGSALFGRGAFDLANKVRRETAHVEFSVLPQFLTDAEKRSLGFQ